MANIVSSIAFVLRQEDSRMTGEVTDDPRDSGGRTRYGIAEKFHPELTYTGYFDGMDAADALKVADTFYDKEYAAPLRLAAIENQQIANAILSFAVNEGSSSSIRVLQQAVKTIDPSVVVDGKFGPGTLAAVNAAGPSTLLTLLAEFQRQHYNAIVAANPQDQAFIKGWFNRIAENCKAV